jgi:hypothetical protein
VTKADYLENEVREIILLIKDERHDGYMRDGLKKKLERLRDLINEELKKL